MSSHEIPHAVRAFLMGLPGTHGRLNTQPEKNEEGFQHITLGTVRVA